MGAGAKKVLVGSPERLLGTTRETCNSLQPARVDALSEGAGTPKVPPEPAKGRREDPVPSTEENLARFEGAPWAFGARFSVPRTASTATFRSSRYQLGSHPFPGELAAKLCSDLFFRGQRLWPQAISYVLVQSVGIRPPAPAQIRRPRQV